MKKQKESLSKSEKCPYLKDPDCGYPNKNQFKFCALFKHCTSYKFLNELKEEKKDGKQNS